MFKMVSNPNNSSDWPDFGTKMTSAIKASNSYWNCPFGELSVGQIVSGTSILAQWPNHGNYLLAGCHWHTSIAPSLIYCYWTDAKLPLMYHWWYSSGKPVWCYYTIGPAMASQHSFYRNIPMLALYRAISVFSDIGQPIMARYRHVCRA